MSKFVRIPEPQSNNGHFLLNLDLVATARVAGTRGLAALAASLNTENNQPAPRGHIKLQSAEQVTLADFTLDTVDEAKHWVKENLGVEL